MTLVFMSFRNTRAPVRIAPRASCTIPWMFFGLGPASGRGLGNAWGYAGKPISKNRSRKVLFLDNNRNVRPLIARHLDIFFLFRESLRFDSQMKLCGSHIHTKRELAKPIADCVFD